MSIYNDLAGLRWLRKCFRSRGEQVEVGAGSWAADALPASFDVVAFG